MNINDSLNAIAHDLHKQRHLPSLDGLRSLVTAWHESAFAPALPSATVTSVIAELIRCANLLATSKKTVVSFEHKTQERKAHTQIVVAAHNRNSITVTITGWLQHLGLVVCDLHPTIVVPVFDKNNTVCSFEPYLPHVHENAFLLLSFNVEEFLTPQKQALIQKRISSCLTHNKQVENDNAKMQRTLQDIQSILEQKQKKEALAFLSWLASQNFNLLGIRKIVTNQKGTSFSYAIEEQSNKGILHNKKFHIYRGLFSSSREKHIVREITESDDTISISKSSERSPVIRPRHLDVISVKIKDNHQYAIYQIVGIFSQSSYLSSVFDIPIFRERCKRVVEQLSQGKPLSYRNFLVDYINLYPRDEVYQSNTSEMLTAIKHDAEANNTFQSNIYIRNDRFKRYSSVMVNFPRNLYRKELPQLVGHWIAEKHNSIYQVHYTHMPDRPMWRIQIILRHIEGSIRQIDNMDLIQEELQDILLSWHDKLIRHLFQENVPLFQSQASNWPELKEDNIFSLEYQKQYNIQNAAYDVKKLTNLQGNVDLALFDGFSCEETDAQIYHLKIYTQGGSIPLHKMTPILNNMGIQILSEIPYSVSLNNKNHTHTIHDFTFRHQSENIAFEKLRHNFEVTCLAALNRHIPDDVFNRLSLVVGMNARTVNLVRAYSWYMKQINLSFTASSTVNALAHYPHITQALIDLFYTRFDPSVKLSRKQRLEKSQALSSQIEEALTAVANLNDDMIFRRYKNLIFSTLRTNFFQKLHPDVQDVITLKFDAQNVHNMPEPKPLREIFVHANEFQACHLRFGLVARGGLRFSDRTEDIRTEILGLAKAQQVKNAVIVPLGAKGGFVLKNPPSQKKAYLEKGVACYRQFIGAMLDITDNRKEDSVIKPPRVVCYDDDDSYLVVAADKGTATFSDYANEIAVERGFWLGDGFASGGSNGYDHKKMGITARGAWESVKRHFKELGINTQKEPFDVVGIGDMSGDVFGNGMLLSQHIRLIAAFNHLHIFIDPDPDSNISFAERKRLFTTSGSNWKDYQIKLITKGGGIFERSSKSLQISKEIMARFDVPQAKISPNELIRCILKSRTDLLWFGGIGTYVKSSSETHAQVSDRANDIIRVDAKELRARVIGEGANLGVTQEARIEFALHGGKCNTDAIDNSAGVDCSDHEVNIKISLNQKIACQAITFAERNRILRRMTNSVAKLVLHHNQRQNDALAFTAENAHANLTQHADMISKLESIGFLNRSIEFLPDEQEIERRQTQGQGLTNPELSVLLAYDKNYTYKNLLESSLPDDPELVSMLINYFPKLMAESFPDDILKHPLRREIIATVITNHIVDHTGPGFIISMKNETDMPIMDIVRAYVIVCNTTGIHTIWKQLDNVRDTLTAQTYNLALIETLNTIKRCTKWLLTNEKDISNIHDVQQKYIPTAKILRKLIPNQVPSEIKKLTLARIQKFSDTGLDANIAKSLGSIKFLSCLFDIALVDIAYPNHRTRSIIQTYFLTSELLGLDWIKSAANTIQPLDRWQQAAIKIAINKTWLWQRKLTEKLVASDKLGNQAIPFLQHGHALPLEHALLHKTDMMTTNRVSISSINVFNDSLSFLCNHIDT